MVLQSYGAGSSLSAADTSRAHLCHLGNGVSRPRYVSVHLGRANAEICDPVFIINGALSVIWGFVIFLFFPTSPQTAAWLTPEEKKLSVERLASNKTGTKNPKIKMDQILEILNPLKDPQGWLLFLLIFFNEFVNGGFSAFFTPDIAALGYSPLESSLLGIPVGASQVFWMVGSAAFTLKFKNVRILMSLLTLIPAFIGFLLQIALPENTHKAAKMVGVCLSIAYGATCALSYQLPAQNAGGFSKRMMMTTMAFCGSAVGNIAGPHVYYSGQHPLYLTGYIVDLVFFGVQAILLFALLFHYKHQVSCIGSMSFLFFYFFFCPPPGEES